MAEQDVVEGNSLIIGSALDEATVAWGNELSSENGEESLEEQAEDGIRDQPRSRGLGDVYKRQADGTATDATNAVTARCFAYEYRPSSRRRDD